jgi:glutathione-regulated potassium-efflux system ancillary protein KefF
MNTTPASAPVTAAQVTSTGTPRILLLQAHPDLHASRVNRTLLATARALHGQAAAPRIEVRDLYALYPDFDLNVAAEQQAAASADLIVWQHPIHWYSMPALMKLWLDQVLTLGWAYGRGGTALAGKDLWLVLSTGAQAHSYQPDGYNRHTFDIFLAPYQQTAALCGLRLLPPLVLHGAHALSEQHLREHAERYQARLCSYPDWPELTDLPQGHCVPLPESDRPVASEPASVQTSTLAGAP